MTEIRKAVFGVLAIVFFVAGISQTMIAGMAERKSDWDEYHRRKKIAGYFLDACMWCIVVSVVF